MVEPRALAISGTPWRASGWLVLKAKFMVVALAIDGILKSIVRLFCFQSNGIRIG